MGGGPKERFAQFSGTYSSLLPSFSAYADGFLLYLSEDGGFRERYAKLFVATYAQNVWGALGRARACSPFFLGGISFVFAPFRAGQVVKVYEYTLGGEGFGLPSGEMEMFESIRGRPLVARISVCPWGEMETSEDIRGHPLEGRISVFPVGKWERENASLFWG